MRMGKLRRLASVSFTVLGLLAVTTPPTSATTAVLVTFQGTAQLSDGIGYPCMGFATIDLIKCPNTFGWGEFATIGKILGTPVTLPVMAGGNTRWFNFATSPCIATGATNPAHQLIAGNCTMWAAGVFTGSCGLGHGLGTFYMAADAVPNGPVTTSGEFHFVDVGGSLVITGDVHNSPTSAVVGVAEAFAFPDLSSLPTIGNSCLAKQADEITIMGAFALVAV